MYTVSGLFSLDNRGPCLYCITWEPGIHFSISPQRLPPICRLRPRRRRPESLLRDRIGLRHPGHQRRPLRGLLPRRGRRQHCGRADPGQDPGLVQLPGGGDAGTSGAEF